MRVPHIRCKHLEGCCHDVPRHSPAGPDPEARAVGVEWEGQLLRTGAPLCQLFCRTRSRSGAEPTSWPGKVDIRMWVQLGHFLER